MERAPATLAILAHLWLAGGAIAQERVSAPLTPGLHFSVREDRYPVPQRSLRDALAALNAGRHGGAEGAPSGVTAYRLEPRWSYRGADGRCVVDALELVVEVEVRIPEWAGMAEATEPERSRWREVLDRITSHEYAHRDATVEVAGALYAELRFLASGSCPRLEVEFARTVSRAQDELERRHAEIDREGGGTALTGS